MVSLKGRVAALEARIGVDEDLPKAIIISVVDSNKDAPKRTDDEHCIGLMRSGYSTPALKIVRKAGESLEAMDDRVGDYEERTHGARGISVWIRAYLDDDSDRMAAFERAQEVAA